jgi:hypothetical protein
MIVALLPGCRLGQCRWETRFIGSAGAFDGSSGAATVSYVNFRQYHNGDPVPSDLIWHITAEQLTSPATGIALRDAQGNQIADLSMSFTSPSSLVASSSIHIADSAGDALFATLAADATTVVVTLQSGATISVPLSIQSREDWHHPDCS